MGVRLADFVVAGLRSRGADAELVDAKAVGLPMLDRMYKEYPTREHARGKFSSCANRTIGGNRCATAGHPSGERGRRN
jgi:hypothetical protein